MKIYKLLPIICLFLVFGGCRKKSPDLYNQNQNQQVTSPSETFLSYWHGMNNSYVLWGIDPTDWDKVYDEYLPRFQALDSQKEVSTYQLEKLYTELSKDLIDHHYVAEITNSRAHVDSIRRFSIRPAINQLEKRNYYHEQDTNFMSNLATIIATKYQPRFKNLVAGRHNTTLIISGNIDNGIAYIYFSGFGLSNFMSDPTNEENIAAVEAVLNFHNIILNTPNLRGVIVDMRNNGGGYTNDIDYILAPMLGEDLQIGHMRPKNGLGRYDYDNWVPLTIHPAVEHRKIDVPIVALVNLYSVSMSEITSTAIKTLDNGYVIGERTYGGTCALTEYEYDYGGSFINSKVNVYTVSVLSKFFKGGIIEGIGVTPDIEILDDPEALSEGIDRQFDGALKLINEKSKK
ncbi:MAG: S41 family peptidase [Mucinivorans sp.]